MDDLIRHEAANARKWDRRAESYDRRRFDYFRWMQKRALALFPLSPGFRLLDLGCGTGFAVRHAAALAHDQGSFHGVDLSPRMVETARAASEGLRSVEFSIATAESLPLSSDFYDAVLCTNSFHHYLHPGQALAEVRRVLRPGGRLCILDVTSDGWLARRIDERTRAREPEHVHFYSTAEYRQMFRRSGLRHLSSRVLIPPVKIHLADKEG